MIHRCEWCEKVIDADTLCLEIMAGTYICEDCINDSLQESPNDIDELNNYYDEVAYYEEVDRQIADKLGK